jgi:putative ATP-binding cassette transporter
LSLGGMMQLASAYVPFQTAIAWAFDNYRALSIWHASARRVAGLIQSMRDLDADLDRPGLSAIDVGTSDDGRIHVIGLTVANREGKIVVPDVDLVVEPGEKLLLTGESGAGKSALARAVVGLWPWGSGAVRLPADARISFVPQRAYMPLGSLRDVLGYPLDRLDADDGAIVAALVRCGIGGLAARLDTVERWDQLLSGGERQRLAFARLILQRPDIVVLDDALAALDDQGQGEIMALLRHELPDATVISVAQRGWVERFHDRTLTLVRTDGSARLRHGAPPGLVAVATAD